MTENREINNYCAMIKWSEPSSRDGLFARAHDIKIGCNDVIACTYVRHSNLILNL